MKVWSRETRKRELLAEMRGLELVGLDLVSRNYEFQNVLDELVEEFEIEEREKALIRELIKFAKQDLKIKAITKGVDPEDGREVYYFLYSPPGFDGKLEDSVTDLDIELFERGYVCEVSPSPYVSDPSIHYMGDFIWRRDMQDLRNNIQISLNQSYCS